MRHYISNEMPDTDGLLTISGTEFRHLYRVLRLSVGDMVHVRLPDGSLRNMTICDTDEKSKKITLQLCGDRQNTERGELPEQENGVEYWLFMFVPRPAKFDIIVRQATECGVSRIVPVSSEFSQDGSNRMQFRSERFERIIKEARQQSGSAVCTTVEPCVTVPELCALWKSHVRGLDESSHAEIVLYERNEKTVPLGAALERKKTIETCALVCGSEGGISPEEIRLLSAESFIPVHFKTNILRCETAALYGIAAIQNAITEKRND